MNDISRALRGCLAPALAVGTGQVLQDPSRPPLCNQQAVSCLVPAHTGTGWILHTPATPLPSWPAALRQAEAKACRKCPRRPRCQSFPQKSTDGGLGSLSTLTGQTQPGKRPSNWQGQLWGWQPRPARPCQPQGSSTSLGLNQPGGITCLQHVPRKAVSHEGRGSLGQTRELRGVGPRPGGAPRGRDCLEAVVGLCPGVLSTSDADPFPPPRGPIALIRVPSWGPAMRQSDDGFDLLALFSCSGASRPWT